MIPDGDVTRLIASNSEREETAEIISMTGRRGARRDLDRKGGDRIGNDRRNPVRILVSFARGEGKEKGDAPLRFGISARKQMQDLILLHPCGGFGTFCRREERGVRDKVETPGSFCEIGEAIDKIRIFHRVLLACLSFRGRRERERE